MMNFKNKVLTLAIALVLLIFGFSSVNAADFTIKMDGPSSAKMAWSQAAQKFKEIVEERSKGRVEVTLFLEGVLTGRNLRTTIQMLQSGGLQMGLFLPAFYEQFDPRWQVFSLPFLFKDKPTVYSVCDGKAGQYMLDTLRKNGIQGLALWEHGFRSFTTSKKPIRVPEDLKGMKLRVMGAPTYISMVKLLGANPTATSMGELFTAMQQGVVDGQENPISSVYVRHFYEVQKYLTLTNHAWNPWVVAMNAEFFDKMPKDLQTILIDAANELKGFERDLVNKVDEEAMKGLQDKMEIIKLTDKELQAWKDATKPVHDEFSDKIGSEVMKLFYEAADY